MRPRRHDPRPVEPAELAEDVGDYRRRLEWWQEADPEYRFHSPGELIAAARRARNAANSEHYKSRPVELPALADFDPGVIQSPTHAVYLAGTDRVIDHDPDPEGTDS